MMVWRRFAILWRNLNDNLFQIINKTSILSFRINIIWLNWIWLFSAFSTCKYANVFRRKIQSFEYIELKLPRLCFQGSVQMFLFPTHLSTSEQMNINTSWLSRELFNSPHSLCYYVCVFARAHLCVWVQEEEKKTKLKYVYLLWFDY